MTIEKSKDRLKKQIIFFKGYFVGRNMLKSIRALELALKFHIGKRSDGREEVSHQIEIAGYLIQVLENKIPNDELDIIIAAAFLHDLVEDYPDKYSLEEVLENFGEAVHGIIKRVSKPANFNKRDTEHKHAYYMAILEDAFSVMVKGGDRMHNIQSMARAFGIVKQKYYIEEVKSYFYPMLRAAREKWPQYYMIFINIQHSLERQIALLEYAHEFAEAVKK